MNTAPRSSPRSHVSRRFVWGLVLLGLLLLSVLLSLTFGARVTGWADLGAALSGQTDTMGQAAVASRIPRTALALLAGAALGLLGGVLQGLTRNPLADPGILGINAGAALAVVTGLAALGFRTQAQYIWLAIGGAGIAALTVYTIAGRGPGGATPLKLALAGAALTAALTSLTTAVVLPRGDIAGLVQSWLVGGVGGATWGRITPVLPFLGVGAVLSLASARKLNMLALGDETAAGLGETAWQARLMGGIGAVTLAGATTAACGPIGFVGLVVPHFCRLVFGVDYRLILPTSALSGAILVLLADVVGRVVVRPAELDVGIVTAFVGAPVFIWIVRRRRVMSL